MSESRASGLVEIADSVGSGMRTVALPLCATEQHGAAKPPGDWNP